MMITKLSRNSAIKIFKIIGVIIFATILFQSPINNKTAAALSDADLDLYSANNIMFYDPDSCKNGHNITGNCGGEVEGSTTEERFRDFVKKYAVVAMNLQIQFGTPWELPFAQAVMESNVGAGKGVDGGVAAKGYYNWMGLTYGSNHFYNIDSAEDSYTTGHGGWSMYRSIQNMVAGFMVDFMRNGYYSDAYQYTDPNNFNYKAFFMAEIEHYCPQYECADHETVYWPVVEKWTKIADEVAAENGWPTSAELAKEKNIPIGGDYPDVNTNIHNQIDAEPHSLNIDCDGGTFDGGGGNGQSGNGNYTGTGDDVTWIGDSISAIRKSYYQTRLPNADFYVQSGKSFHKVAGEGSNTNGLDILKQVKESGKLRKNLVFALGSNNGVEGLLVTQDDIDTLLSLAESCDKIILLTNYNKNNANGYSSNNELFKKTAEANPKVILMDWKGAASKDPEANMDDYVHPSAKGAEIFADLIIQGLGMAKHDTDGQNDECDCEESVNVEGGLTDEQAEKLVAYFKNDANDSKWTPSIKKWNCVSLSTFFVQLFTDVEGESILSGGSKKGCISCHNGVDVANGLSSYGVEVGEELRPFSIFSVSGPSAYASGSAGHTGVVLAVNGDELTIIEAGWGNDGYAAVRKYDLNQMQNRKFAYLGDHMDWSALSEAIGESVSDNTSTNANVPMSDAKWSDGWITSGFDGYEKKVLSGSGDSAHNGDFVTDQPKGGGKGPNKILLHSTEGGNAGGDIEAIYNNGSGFPPHFTIDMKNKKLYQHYPITKPADAIKSYDHMAGIQIEIIGFSSSSNSSSPWYLYNDSNYGDEEWEYLAKFLNVLSAETGIPLETSVDWTKESRLSVDAFKEYKGVLGHMHAPDNDHNDPGNIWPKLEGKLGKFMGTGECGRDNVTDVPCYAQCDDRWRNSPYDSGCGGTVCSSGCGCTSFAMMASGLTHQEYLPDEVCLYAGQKGMHACDENGNGQGSSHSLPLVIGEHFGVKAEDMGSPSVEQVSDALRDGWMIWTCGSGPEPFSSGGHCIGVRGITGDGKWLLANSAFGSCEEEKWNKEWEPSQVYPYMNNFKKLKAL